MLNKTIFYQNHYLQVILWLICWKNYIFFWNFKVFSLSWQKFLFKTIHELTEHVFGIFLNTDTYGRFWDRQSGETFSGLRVCMHTNTRIQKCLWNIYIIYKFIQILLTKLFKIIIIKKNLSKSKYHKEKVKIRRSTVGT